MTIEEPLTSSEESEHEVLTFIENTYAERTAGKLAIYSDALQTLYTDFAHQHGITHVMTLAFPRASGDNLDSGYGESPLEMYMKYALKQKRVEIDRDVQAYRLTQVGKQRQVELMLRLKH